MFGWSWKKIVIGVSGVLIFAAGFVFPPAAAILSPLGAGLVGLAVKTPGDVTETELLAHGRAVAGAVAPAVVAAVVQGQAAGESISQLGGTVKAAAANALATQQKQSAPKG
ncbi:MAG TPA: hypothetical protein VJ801_07335 [Polyangia bacterium]|jgi:hypothetical protein|nr:hypothetical protein [Polyangia bacterium]